MDNVKRYIGAFTATVLASELDGLDVSWRRGRRPGGRLIVDVVLYPRDGRTLKHGVGREELLDEISRHRAPEDQGERDARHVLDQLQKAAAADAGAETTPAARA